MLTSGVHCFVDVAAASKDVDVAVMVGGYPRKAGEERKVGAGRHGRIGGGEASLHTAGAKCLA